MIFDRILLTDHVHATDADGAIDAVAEAGLRAGVLTPSYVADVHRREAVYPTALPTSPYGIAIPHATPTEEGSQASLCVARLDEPVVFREMGSTSGRVEVRLVFLLNLPARDHMGLLGALARLFQDPESVRRLGECEDAELFIKVKSALESSGIPVEGLS